MRYLFTSARQIPENINQRSANQRNVNLRGAKSPVRVSFSPPAPPAFFQCPFHREGIQKMLRSEAEGSRACQP